MRNSLATPQCWHSNSNRWCSTSRQCAKRTCVKPNMQFVAVHDAARPCVPSQDIESVFSTVRKTRAAILPCFATVKRVDAEKRIKETVPRDGFMVSSNASVF
ncbi:MAG: 2-C-methyl-D-erythritol 4-phosphate cytidylyltransferase [Pirellulales bacterium]